MNLKQLSAVSLLSCKRRLPRAGSSLRLIVFLGALLSVIAAPLRESVKLNESGPIVAPRKAVKTALVVLARLVHKRRLECAITVNTEIDSAGPRVVWWSAAQEPQA